MHPEGFPYQHLIYCQNEIPSAIHSIQRQLEQDSNNVSFASIIAELGMLDASRQFDFDHINDVVGRMIARTTED